MITPSTGGHIHFDHSILDDENIITFLKLWYVAEDIIYEYATGEFEHLRKGAELYAEKLDQKLKKRIAEYEEGKLELSEFAYFDKCYGLNLYNHLSSHRAIFIAIDTYEVRVPNGTLDIATWQNNVEFFASLFLYADSKKSKPVIEKLYKNGKLEVTYENLLLLSDLIFRSDAAKYRFLNQFHEKKQFNGHPTKKRWF